MARRPNVTIHGNTTHDDDPPPSTLAAQIVQNQTRPAESQRHEETASFRDLLHEILHNQAAAQEHDVNVNTQLVSVVNQAGLIPLTVDNPFAEWDMLIPQAKDSIAVIEFTVQRQPDVLFTELTANGPQLALSLIATSVALCGRPKCEEISASRVLIAATRTLDSSIHLWQRALTLRCVLQDCVDGR
jgi:serine/threonine-protein kinase ATR